jgi:hypothetical protein
MRDCRRTGLDAGEHCGRVHRRVFAPSASVAAPSRVVCLRERALSGPSTNGLISARIHTCWRQPPTFFSGSQCRWNARNKPALLSERLKLSMLLALFAAAFITIASAAAAEAWVLRERIAANGSPGGISSRSEVAFGSGPLTTLPARQSRTDQCGSPRQWLLHPRQQRWGE